MLVKHISKHNPMPQMLNVWPIHTFYALKGRKQHVFLYKVHVIHHTAAILLISQKGNFWDVFAFTRNNNNRSKPKITGNNTTLGKRLPIMSWEWSNMFSFVTIIKFNDGIHLHHIPALAYIMFVICRLSPTSIPPPRCTIIHVIAGSIFLCAAPEWQPQTVYR